MRQGGVRYLKVVTVVGGFSPNCEIGSPRCGEHKHSIFVVIFGKS